MSDVEEDNSVGSAADAPGGEAGVAAGDGLGGEERKDSSEAVISNRGKFQSQMNPLQLKRLEEQKKAEERAAEAARKAGLASRIAAFGGAAKTADAAGDNDANGRQKQAGRGVPEMVKGPIDNKFKEMMSSGIVPSKSRGAALLSSRGRQRTRASRPTATADDSADITTAADTTAGKVEAEATSASDSEKEISTPKASPPLSSPALSSPALSSPALSSPSVPSPPPSTSPLSPPPRPPAPQKPAAPTVPPTADIELKTPVAEPVMSPSAVAGKLRASTLVASVHAKRESMRIFTGARMSVKLASGDTNSEPYPDAPRGFLSAADIAEALAEAEADPVVSVEANEELDVVNSLPVLYSPVSRMSKAHVMDSPRRTSVAILMSSLPGTLTYKYLMTALKTTANFRKMCATKNLETLLTRDEFKRVFEMPPEEFNKLPAWQQTSLRKKTHLKL